MYSAAKFPRSHNVMTPKDEIEMGRVMAEDFWNAVHREAPGAKKIQLLGNHDIRPHKRIMEKVPELEQFFDFSKLFEFNQVETIHDPTQELVMGDTCFIHGHRKHGTHFTYNLMNTVLGHTHTGGVVFAKVYDPRLKKEKIIWELNVGYLADPTHKALMYRPQKWSRWTHGFGIIDKFGPRFIPLDDS